MKILFIIGGRVVKIRTRRGLINQNPVFYLDSWLASIIPINLRIFFYPTSQFFKKVSRISHISISKTSLLFPPVFSSQKNKQEKHSLKNAKLKCDKRDAVNKADGVKHRRWRNNDGSQCQTSCKARKHVTTMQECPGDIIKTHLLFLSVFLSQHCGMLRIPRWVTTLCSALKLAESNLWRQTCKTGETVTASVRDTPRQPNNWHPRQRGAGEDRGGVLYITCQLSHK